MRTVRQPVRGLDRRSRPFGDTPRARRRRLVPHLGGHLGKAARRLDPETLQVDLLVRWRERTAFHPAVADAAVVDKAVAVGVRCGGEGVGLDDGRPVLLEIGAIASCAPEIGVGDDIERRRIGARPCIRKVAEPRHERGALRNLVRDLAILTLEFRQERQRGARGVDAARGGQPQRRPKASRPKNQANPGRSLFPDVRKPATSPVPSAGFVASPLSMPTSAQSKARLRRGSGVVTRTEVVISRE